METVKHIYHLPCVKYFIVGDLLIMITILFFQCMYVKVSKYLLNVKSNCVINIYHKFFSVLSF